MIKNKDFATTLESHLTLDISKEAKTILEEAIYQIKAIGTYVSKLFKRGKSLTIQPTPAFTIIEENVNDSWKKVRERESERANPTPSFDNDIWKWFKDIIIPEIPFEHHGTIQRFTQTLNHQQILAESEKLFVKKIYSWLEAKKYIEEVILAGEVDVKGLGVIVYFKVEGNDTLYRFHAYRDGVDKLHVNVNKGHGTFDWYADNGAVFS